MAFEHRPGSLSLFKNDRKNSDSHPDYAGDGMDLAGNPVWVNAWIKEGAKGKFFSISLKAKEPARDTQRGGGGSHSPSDDPLAGGDRRGARPLAEDEALDIPFVSVGVR